MIEGSALATKLALGPSSKPKRLVVFGAGVQIETHVNLFLRAFSSSLTECTIFNRSMNSRLEKLVSTLKQNHPTVTFISKSLSAITSSDNEECKRLIGSADIICTATPSLRPLFPGHYVKSGTHLNLIGSYTPSMMEIDKELVDRAGIVIVDSKDACIVEAGELICAGVHQDRMMELGELVEFQARSMTLAGEHEVVREYAIAEEKCQLIQNSGDVTIFKSVGVGIQDVAIASLVVRLAEERGLGTRIQAYDA